MTTKAQQIRADDETQDRELPVEATELPDGWSWSYFESIAINNDGRRIPVKQEDRAKRQGSYPYYGASGIIDHVDDYLFDGHFLLIGEDGANLLARSTPIAFRAQGQFWVNNHAHVLQTRGKIPLEYLEHYINSIDLQEYVTGSAQPKLTQDAMNRIPVPIAPLAEQKRIVAKINESLKQLSETKLRLNKIPILLKYFRRAVLAAGCSGKLTEDWRKAHDQVEPAVTLLARILANHMERRNLQAKGVIETNGIPDAWAWAQGWQLLTWGSGKFLPKKDQQSCGRFDIYGGNGIIGKHSKFITAGSTLVIGRVGAQCGNVYVTDGPAWITDNAIYAAKIAAGLDLEYLSFVFKQANLNANAGGSGQPFVSQETLNSVAIPLPPTEEQKEIVRRVEKLFKLADAIEKRVVAASVRAEKMTQAILAKSFRGELVPTEAELARREGRTYEPASVLLERIKAERAAADKKTTKGGKKARAVAAK